ncbi:MAG: hypothetical protein P4L22_06110 [Candidatus Babeliales bacterium]|nr:hypothetical protein [Candidatus Babeliales bacterium]
MKIIKFIALIVISVLAFPIKASEPKKSNLEKIGKFLFDNRRTVIPIAAMIYYKDKADKDAILKVCALILGNELMTSMFGQNSPDRSKADGWQIDSESEEFEYTRLPVLVQDKADCGYHAIKNGKYVYQMLQSIISNSIGLQKISSADDKVFPLETQRKYILNKFRNNNGDGTNLSDLEIEDLIENKEDYKNINYIIIPNLLDEESIGLDENLTNVVRLLREEPQRIQLFILGTMVHFQGKEKEQNTKGSVGHWISIIAVKKNNKFKYYAMDSLPSGNAIVKLFKTLQNLIEKQDLQMLQLIPQLEQKITAIIHNLSDPENKSGDNRLINATLQIQNIIDIFTKNNFRSNNKYVLQVRKILSTMQDSIKDLSQEQIGWIEIQLMLINNLP